MDILDKASTQIQFAGRLLIAYIFVMAGWGKIVGYAGTVAYMEAKGIPGALLPLVILTELGGGLAVAVGFQTRLAAFLLAGFSIVSAVVFHYQPGDQAQMIGFMKNLAMAGGFLFIVANGPGAWSMDAMIGTHKNPGVA